MKSWGQCVLIPIRKRLDDGAQADVYPDLGLIFIDAEIDEAHWPDLIEHALLKIAGEPAPYAVCQRPEFTLYRGGLDAG